jgi:hypothetical protein
VIRALLRRFRLRRMRYWETRYIEAHGRVIDIELGNKGVLWSRAMFDRTIAEKNYEYYQGKLNAVGGGKA